MADPFYAAKDDIQRNMGTINALYVRFKQLDSGDGTVDEMEWTSAELKTSLRDVHEILSDLERALPVMEANPARFKLDAEEVASRRGFVAEMRGTVNEIRDALKSKVSKQKQDVKNKNALLSKSGADGRHRLDDAIREDHQAFIDGQAGQQQQIIDRQDREMDELGNVVTRVGNMAIAIKSEIDSHTVALNEFEGEVDRVQGRMTETVKRLEQFIKNSQDKGKICTIVILFIVLIVIIVFLFR